MQRPSFLELKTEQCPHLVDVTVIFTGVQSALESLRVASHLTSGLSMQINLLVKDERADPRSTITEVMLADFTSRYFLTFFPHTPDLRIRVRRYPASSEDLWEVLPPGSIIVISGPFRRFRLSSEQKLARKLCRAGHEVILMRLCSSRLPLTRPKKSLSKTHS